MHKPNFIPDSETSEEQLRKSNIKLLSKIPVNNKKRLMYSVECLHCGKQWLKESYGIGKSQCQCYKARAGAYNYKGDGSVCAIYYNRIKDRAIQRDIPFEITISDMWNKYTEQKGICALTGLSIQIQRNYKKKHLMDASLDRIDSEKAYTKDNIQWIHKDINRMKNQYSEEYFIKMCKLIIKYDRQKRRLKDYSTY